ncbi:hypothetical protein [Edaphobacter dinghuensis]|uniref:hypothetical protein n=1 Tax=Edaphobacter dinghuensis TaxID=1560005 RepID=UPI00166B0FF4|nr:hypothetical protein [Edaphobacter dinghuensis]
MYREDYEGVHDSESDQIRDVYAYYGLAMYMAQNLERGLAMLLALERQKEGMTAWDFDARLAENYQSTFGDLVSRFLKSPLAASSGLSAHLQRANEQRNDLAHQYFWDRGIQFVSPEGRLAMIAELRQMKTEFERLDDDLQAFQEADLKARGEDIHGFRSRVNASLHGYLSGSAIPHSPELLPNKVTVVAAEEWCSTPDRPGNLVLISREGRFLVPGGWGLCYGPPTIPNGSVARPLAFDRAFPAELNPRPKTSSSWNYGIPLANGYVLRAQTLPGLEIGQFRVWIQPPQPNT